MSKVSLFSKENVTRSERSLHTPGTFAKQNLLYVQEVGRLESLTPHRCIRENLDSYLFMIVLEGKGTLEVRGQEYEITKGNCALLDCMNHYEHISDEQDAWKLAWVHFNGVSAKAYYDLFYKYQQENVFEIKDIEQWNALIGKLLEKQKDKSFLAELGSAEILLQLLNKVIEVVVDKDTLKAEEFKQKNQSIREFLNEEYANQNVLKALEMSIGSKIDTLNEDFSRYYGIGIIEYLENKRLNVAKELLRFTIKTAEEISVESGIGTYEVMEKLFVDKEGVTPQEYREKWAQWIRM